MSSYFDYLISPVQLTQSARYRAWTRARQEDDAITEVPLVTDFFRRKVQNLVEVEPWAIEQLRNGGAPWRPEIIAQKMTIAGS